MSDCAILMASNTKFSYLRLRNKSGFVEEEREKERLIWTARSWFRLRKVASKKKLKVRIPGLRRFLKRRAKVVSAVRVSWIKVLRRLKESGSYMGDLFAGNYIFMQVNPALKYVDKSFVGHDHHGFSSRYPLGRIA